MSKSGVYNALMAFLLMCGIHVSGKETARVDTTHREFVISYVFDGTSRDFNSNEIIRDLSNDAVKNLRSTRVKLGFDLRIAWEADSGNDCRMELSYLNPSFTGDHFFRGFDISDVVLPTRSDLEFYMTDPNDSSAFRGYSWMNCPVSWKDSVSQEFSLPCLDPARDSVQFSSLYLYYDEEALNRFRLRTTLIHDYYASCSILDSLLILAYSMDFQKPENYPLYFVFIEEINKAVEIIGKKQFSEGLQLSRFDPKGFIRKYEELFKLSRSVTMTFEERLDGAEQIPVSVSSDSAVAVFFSGMMRYIDWTLLVNERNGNIYHDYLENYYSLNAFGDDLFILRKLIRKAAHGENEDTLLSRVFHLVSIGYKSRAALLMQENHFAEALELIENGRRFADFNPFREKETVDDSSRFLAANGIFSSYLGVAESSIRHRKYDMAEAYLAKARAYRQANYSPLISDSLYRRVFLMMVQGQIAECDSMASRKEFQESLDCFRYFEAGYDTSSITMILPDLQRKKERVYTSLVNDLLRRAAKYLVTDMPDSALVLFDMARELVAKTTHPQVQETRMDSLSPDYDKIRYKQFLAKTANQFHRRDYAGAFVSLTSAKSLLQRYNAKPDTAFDTLWEAVYPQYLQHLLMVSEKKIWTNQLQDAASFADSIAGLQPVVSPEARSGLLLAVERYRSRIREKVCFNAREAIEIYCLRAGHYIEQKKYNRTEELLDSALKVNEKAQSCRLAVGYIRDTLQKYRDAAVYQHATATIENRISVDRYTEALQKYIEAYVFFNSHSVARFGLVCEPVFEFVRGKSNLRFTFAAVEFFIAKKECGSAMEYLKLYRIQGGEAESAKEIQRTLGREMAHADFIRTPEKDPVILAETYTSHDKWMISFDRSYIFQWNVLKNGAASSKGSNE